jgi:hypothetical protein
VELVVHRIAQESLTNVGRRARDRRPPPPAARRPEGHGADLHLGIGDRALTPPFAPASRPLGGVRADCPAPSGGWSIKERPGGVDDAACPVR